jgi:diguanylate cyclase (GGDEF)-like protein
MEGGSENLKRARRTAAWARAAIAAAGLALLAAEPSLAALPLLPALGFALIGATALVQAALPDHRWLVLEESLAAFAAVLIVGLASQRVDVLQVLWLSAVAAGVLARGGRVHWVGRALLLAALAMPIVIDGRPEASHLGLALAAIALLLACGRVTNELRGLLVLARFEADHDALTGALSRAAFHRELARRDHAAGVGLVLVDLDDFGQVNKLHGHATGDEVLSGAVGRLRETGGRDAVIGRLGGDELGIVVAVDAAPGVAAAAQAALARPFGPVALGASIGVATSPAHGGDAEALMRAADVALRVAKRSGRGQVQTYAGADVGRRGPTGARGALERLIRGEGLTMAVQPIVDWRRGRVHAVEALARFRTRSDAGPLHWFALADEFDLRDELELACLRAALALYAERPPGVALSINLSGPVLLDPRASHLITRAADLSGLIVEVTEDTLVRHDAGLAAVTGPLAARGVAFAIDDIGAGYAGLRQITALEPAYLKLDRAMVQAIETDPRRSALVEALVGYAERTGGQLVAEGVETVAELGHLQGLGVPLIQGYLLGRPDAPWPRTTRAASAVPAAISP